MSRAHLPIGILSCLPPSAKSQIQSFFGLFLSGFRYSLTIEMMASLRLVALLASAAAAERALAAAPQRPQHPAITAAPELVRRDTLDPFVSGVSSFLSALGSDVPSYVASGT